MFRRKLGHTLSDLVPPVGDSSEHWPHMLESAPSPSRVHGRPGAMYSIHWWNEVASERGQGHLNIFLPDGAGDPLDHFPLDFIIPPTLLSEQEDRQDIAYLVGLAAGAQSHIRAHPNPAHTYQQHLVVMAHSHSLLKGLLQSASSVHLRDHIDFPEEPKTVQGWQDDYRAVALAVALYRHPIRECSDWTARRYAGIP